MPTNVKNLDLVKIPESPLTTRAICSTPATNFMYKKRDCVVQLQLVRTSFKTVHTHTHTHTLGPANSLGFFLYASGAR